MAPTSSVTRTKAEAYGWVPFIVRPKRISLPDTSSFPPVQIRIEATTNTKVAVRDWRSAR